MSKKKIVIGAEPLTIEAVLAISRREMEVELCSQTAYKEKINGGARFLDEMLEKHDGIYGVTTGYGDSCTETVPPELYYDLPVHLTRFHGCGLGSYFDPETTRAIIAVRMNTLAQGFSGVSYELLSYLEFLLQKDILPLIPEEGSVGASGDLTPLSYIGGTLIGERDVLYQGQIRPAAEVMQQLGKPLYRFRPKEAIAIMNGTAVMNAVACLAFDRGQYLADLSCRITAMNSIALKGNQYHFFQRLFDVKPHPGQARAAERIRNSFATTQEQDIMPERIQDPYSIRCAPHIIGMFYETEDLFRTIIETEMNSANDNPIIDPDTRSIFHGGHFYGGHICFVMDSLKNIVCNLADLLDRQLAVMVDIKFNRGLPPNLSGSSTSFSINHGFKAVQIGASAWTAEALKNAVPVSVFSRSTECHNQDKVSMGTIAARDCLRVIQLAEQVASATLLAAVQALRIRLERQEISTKKMAGVQDSYQDVSSYFIPLEEDRPLERDLRTTLEKIRSKSIAC